jgi:hypothetical protein
MRARLGSAERVVLPVPLEPESGEERPVSLFAVAETMHGEDVTFRRKVIHYCEHTLRHFAGIFGAEDDQLPVFDTEANAGLGLHSHRHAVRRKSSGVVDHKVRFAKLFQFFRCGPDERVVHEKRMVGSRANDAYFDPYFGSEPANRQSSRDARKCSKNRERVRD